jgi:hypothetical protein
VAQLFWAGLAKLGPWFHSGAIVSGMVGNSLLVPAPLRRAMFHDIPAGDLRPSRLAAALALFGTVTEVAAPVLAVWPGEGALPAQLRLLGVLGCAGTHLFIVSHVPLGSLMEWNSFNLLATVLVYRILPAHFTGLLGPGLNAGAAGWPRLAAGCPLLATFLAGSLYACPLVGLFRPHWFWYAFSLQQYTGNWPSKFLLLRRAAAPRLARGVPLSPALALPGAARTPETPEEAFRAAAFEALDHRRHLNHRALARNVIFTGLTQNLGQL